MQGRVLLAACHSIRRRTGVDAVAAGEASPRLGTDWNFADSVIADVLTWTAAKKPARLLVLFSLAGTNTPEKQRRKTPLVCTTRSSMPSFITTPAWRTDPITDKPATIYVVSVFEKPYWRTLLTTKDMAEALAEEIGDNGRILSEVLS
jgi:hypothetical protein